MCVFIYILSFVLQFFLLFRFIFSCYCCCFRQQAPLIRICLRYAKLLTNVIHENNIRALLFSSQFINYTYTHLHKWATPHFSSSQLISLVIDNSQWFAFHFFFSSFSKHLTKSFLIEYNFFVNKHWLKNTNGKSLYAADKKWKLRCEDWLNRFLYAFRFCFSFLLTYVSIKVDIQTSN